MADPLETFLDGPLGPPPDTDAVPDADLSFAPTPLPQRAVLENAIQSVPEVSETNQKVAKDLDLPVEAVEAAPKETADFKRMRELDEALFGAPPRTKTLMQQPDFAKVAHPNVEELSTTENLVRSLELGALTRQLGLAQAERRDFGDSPETLATIADIKKRIEAAGVDAEGFESWLTAAAQVVGLQINSFGSPEAFRNIVGGGAIGATTGAIGGPAAPATAAAGGVLGAGVGATAHFATDAFLVEGGLAFADMIEQGVDRDTASWLSYGVGAINSALEVAGASVLLRPVTEPLKAAMRQGVRDAAKSATVRGIATTLAKTYAAGVTAETGTEVAQRFVTLMAQQMGVMLSDLNEKLLTTPEIIEDLTEEGIQAFKAMAILALPGPSINAIVETSAKVSKAKRNREVLQQVNEAAKGSKLAQVSQEKAVQHLTESLEEVGVTDVFIPAAEIDAAAEKLGTTPDALHDRLGTTEQAEFGRLSGGDVKVKAKDYAAEVLQTDLFNELGDHTRLADEDMTAAEAATFEKEGLKEEAERLDRPIPEAAITFETPGAGILEEREKLTEEDVAFRQEALDTVIKQVEFDLGLDGLFKTAKEAALTPKEYETYLVELQKGAQAAATREERRELKRRAKENTKAFKAERERVKVEVEEEVRLRPVYAAVDAIGVDRLNEQEVLDLLAASPSERKVALSQLPKQKGRNIFAKDGKLSPATLAEIYEFDHPDLMLFAMMDAPSFASVVELETNQRMEASAVAEEGTAIENALEALHNDNHAEILAFEINQLRQAKKQKRIKASTVKKIAQERIGQIVVGDVKPHKFLAKARKSAAEARKLLRSGDREGAAIAKFQQLLNFQMAQLAYPAQAKVQKQRKFLDKFLKRPKKGSKLPVEYLQAIRTILSDVNLGIKMSDAKRTKLLEFAQRKAMEEGTTLQIPKAITDEVTRKSHQDMTLDEWNTLHDSVKELQHAGLGEDKMLREAATASRQEIVDEIIPLIKSNLKSREGEVIETAGENLRAHGREAAWMLLNAGSVARTIDGFQDFGPMFNATVARYNRAMTEGYLPGQVGFTDRMKAESEAMLELFSVFTDKERKRLKDRIEIPGVQAKMSHNRVLSVLRNLGNEDNKKALVESGQFTEEELVIIGDFASKRDWEHTQAVWDYLDKFFPEIAETAARRRGTVVEKVVPTAITNKHGTFKGGYYPLVYDPKEAALGGFKTTDDIVQEARFGKFHMSHTKHNHTEARIGSGGNPVLLDTFVLNGHVNQVVYDLEVGDAVNDIYKVLHHKDLKQAFRENGSMHVWDNLDIWANDLATGEMHYGGMFEHMFRWIRTGFVVSKIGYSAGTTLVQLLGLLQSSVAIGKMNMFRGVYSTLAAPQFGPNSVWKMVSAESGFMRQREANFNREIVEAQTALSASIVARFTPGKSAEVFARGAFWGIIKLQRVVDVMTWMGARQAGMQKFDGDVQKATEFADLMVERSQATGIQGGRTQLERGTAGRKVQQSEGVRVLVPLISYFMAKTNVAYERTRRTNFRNPGQAIGWAVDMAILYTVEALIVLMMREGLPDEEENLLQIALWETIKSVGVGVPGLRDVLSEVEGFRGGGTIASSLGEVKKFYEQAEQGDIDTALVKSAGRLSGTLLRIPGANQAVKTGETLSLALDGEDIEAAEWIFGPRWEE